MTLQQLRYLIAVAEHGSINAAARNLYTAQSNVSCAMRDLEEEFGFEIFTRSNRGVELTAEGTELLGYARQVIEQADMLEERFIQGSAPQERLAVSAQHYAFSVQAFVDVVKSCSSPEYDFVMRETATGAIISDVRDFRSEIGILYLDDFNRPVLEKAFEDARLDFHPLFDAPVHVFVGEQHPLRRRTSSSPKTSSPIRATPSSRERRTLSIILKSRFHSFHTERPSATPTAARSRAFLPTSTAIRSPQACSRTRCSQASPRSLSQERLPCVSAM